MAGTHEARVKRGQRGGPLTSGKLTWGKVTVCLMNGEVRTTSSAAPGAHAACVSRPQTELRPIS